ncbi:B3 domain-containing protein At2g31420-like [Prosopis cineraria]|uniref:B3 domain-containing protein At2g31420-like n=1 Tax=Prosopis cineraria TaxID=364024 RepID=UPI00240F4939|nr:B3 domain-containing protein At2g31420-like [Prosopis cineraria]
MSLTILTVAQSHRSAFFRLQIASSVITVDQKIDDMGGHDIQMVIEEKLCESDTNSNNNRFSIPENKILKEARGNFLQPQEVEFLKTCSTNNKRPQRINVLVLEPNLQEFNLLLKRWQMKSCSTYNLIYRWKHAQSNDLKVNDMVQLWSFRRLDDQLGSALVKLNKKILHFAQV